MSLWWVSFCDPERETGTQFLGACIVDDDDAGVLGKIMGDICAAVSAASANGCNPGGEAMGIQVPDDVAPRIAREWRNRLLTREECEEFDRVYGDPK
jgi:hypothetical protein